MELLELTTTFQGELPLIGKACSLIRFSGCNLSCFYCDTKNKTTKSYTLDEVLDFLHEKNMPSILITGGEPLLHTHVLTALIPAVRRNFPDTPILIETNGTISFDWLHSYKDITIIADYKLFKNKKASKQNIYKGIRKNDIIKFVFWNEQSFQKARTFIRNFYATWKEQKMPMFVFSPILPFPEPAILQDCIEDVKTLSKIFDNVDIRIQVQIHKVLNIP